MMMRFARFLVPGFVVLLAGVGGAQTTGPAGTQGSPPTGGAGGVMDPVAERALRLLQDRKGTLKDFTAVVEYDVYHGRTDDHEGKTGTVDFVEDPVNGPTFSVHFTHDTADGKVVKKHEQDLVFDGRTVTMIDRRAMQYRRETVLPKDAKPGDAVSLNGPMPLPIGMKVAEVRENFDVSVVPAKDAGGDVTVLKLTPKAELKGQIDFKELELTVDGKLELPTKMVRTDKKGDVTTIEFKEPAINEGKAKMIDTAPPKGEGWDIDIK